MKILLPAILLLMLAGCSTTAKVAGMLPGVNKLIGEEGYVRDRKDEYLQAQTLPPTRIPDSLDSYMIDDLYVIPEVSGEVLSDNGRVPRPRPLEGNNEREVVIQRINNESWIVAGASPSQIWPRVKDYWAVNRIPLAFENPTAGIMDTTWFALNEERTTQEKFRVSVENGFQDNSSEIRILHQSAPLAVPPPAQATFPEKSADQEVANKAIQDMSQYLAEVADIYQAAAVSFLAGNISSEGKASLNTLSDGSMQLVLQSDYERSWAAVGLALNRAPGVEVVSRNADDGVYEINYIITDEAEEEPGFFKSLFTFGGDPVYTMRLQLLPSGDTVLVEALEMDVDGKPEDGDNAPNSLVQLIRRVIA